MSHHFGYLLKNTCRFIFFKDNKSLPASQSASIVRFIVLITGVICHGAYVYETLNVTEITVQSKYQITKNGFTQFMIMDTQGNHYNINNSFWFMKWNSIEDWVNIKEKEKYLIQSYGLRIPMLGLFPNIFYTNKI